MSAAQGLAKRLFAAKVVMATRRRLLQAQRKDTPRCLPDALVTGVIPASAATWSGWSNTSRASPHSARIWPALIVPERGKERKICPSGWVFILWLVERSRFLIAVLSADSTPTW